MSSFSPGFFASYFCWVWNSTPCFLSPFSTLKMLFPYILDPIDSINRIPHKTIAGICVSLHNEPFSSACFQIFSFLLILDTLIRMELAGFLHVLCALGSPNFLDLTSFQFSSNLQTCIRYFFEYFFLCLFHMGLWYAHLRLLGAIPHLAVSTSPCSSVDPSSYCVKFINFVSCGISSGDSVQCTVISRGLAWVMDVRSLSLFHMILFLIPSRMLFLGLF